MKILVTGGAGFIGSNIANALIEEREEEEEREARARKAHEHTTKATRDDDSKRKENNNKPSKVIALDDLSLGSISNLSKQVKFVKGSVMDYDLVLELSKECNYIFHHAALSSSPMFVNDPRKGVDINVMGFMNVMEAAKRNKVKKVIYASSSSVYNGLPIPFKESYIVIPKTFYESSFYCREIIAKTYYLEHGLNSIGLRYFSIYGPNEKHKGRFANNISQFIWDIAEKRKSPVIYGDGNQTRDFTFVGDVVQANILAMRKRGGGGSSSYDNYYDRSSSSHPNSENISHLDNNDDSRGSRIYNIGTGIQTSFNQLIGIINKHLGTNIKPTYISNPINNYVLHTNADISLARLELGYEPKWKNLDDGIKKLLLSSSSQSIRI
jgi:UDP-glucose 4-epimerase